MSIYQHSYSSNSKKIHLLFFFFVQFMHLEAAFLEALLLAFMSNIRVPYLVNFVA